MTYKVCNSRNKVVYKNDDITMARAYYEAHMKRGWYIKYPKTLTTPEVLLLIDTFNDDMPVMGWNSTDQHDAIAECDRNNCVLFSMRYRLIKVTVH